MIQSKSKIQENQKYWYSGKKIGTIADTLFMHPRAEEVLPFMLPFSSSNHSIIQPFSTLKPSGNKKTCQNFQIQKGISTKTLKIAKKGSKLLHMQGVSNFCRRIYWNQEIREFHGNERNLNNLNIF